MVSVVGVVVVPVGGAVSVEGGNARGAWPLSWWAPRTRLTPSHSRVTARCRSALASRWLVSPSGTAGRGGGLGAVSTMRFTKTPSRGACSSSSSESPLDWD